MIDFPEWVVVSPCRTVSSVKLIGTRHGMRWEVWTVGLTHGSLRVRFTRSIGR